VGTCVTPNTIPPEGGKFTGSTSGVSGLAGSCGPTSGAAPENVFTWTPAVSGTAIIETCSATLTTFNTVLHVRTSCTLPGTEIAMGCNNDTVACDTLGGPGLGSRVMPTVTAGVPLSIIVDGNDGASFGNFQLRVIPPAGTCAVPNVIPAAGGMVVGRTSGASAQAGSGACALMTAAAPENVYSWTPATTGTATIETCSTTMTAFDTVLYVRGSPCATGTQLACNDSTVTCDTGSGVGEGSRVMVSTTAGTPLFIFVDGVDGTQAGDFSLTVTP
jgi:hypothetical protein